MKSNSDMNSASCKNDKPAAREKLLVLLGPTASGKTDLSIRLAKALGTEIISGDSMLVYKGFDIGSAKPTAEEMSGIRHHMIDILPPDASFNLMDFLQQAKEIITRLNQQGKIPLLAGGTGLYIQSLLEGYELNSQSEDTAYRNYLEKLAEEKGREYVHGMLAKVNPQAAARLHINDFRRIIRALEVHHLGGEQLSQKKSRELVYDCYVAGLTWRRDKLYDRINQRVNIMMSQGLPQEIANLLQAGVAPDVQAMKGIGYKELLPVLTGNDVDMDTGMQQAVAKIQQNSRHFAKRQLTWYRRMPYIHWYQPELYKDTGMLADNLLWDVQRWINK
ncbi:tRNA (adenosine(37)-N6)-dimethylallyltransferase MiaA [Anaerovibrio slackiae]|uniref:tRNA (adenosine(37)-N6)-dimethylallyltransferase MiaA n=1 Tax=Anaerovibrio slackiae TaxID=2652309 RepID=UPI003864219F